MVPLPQRMDVTLRWEEHRLVTVANFNEKRDRIDCVDDSASSLPMDTTVKPCPMFHVEHAQTIQCTDIDKMTLHSLIFGLAFSEPERQRGFSRSPSLALGL